MRIGGHTDTVTRTLNIRIVTVHWWTRLIFPYTEKPAITIWTLIRLLYRALKTLWVTTTLTAVGINITGGGRVTFTATTVFKVVLNKGNPLLKAHQAITVLINTWSSLFWVTSEELFRGWARLLFALIVDQRLKLTRIKRTALINIKLTERIQALLNFRVALAIACFPITNTWLSTICGIYLLTTTITRLNF